MNHNTSAQPENLPASRNKQNRSLMRAIRYFSWGITLVFLIFLAWAIYQAIFLGSPLPAMSWLGIAVLLAAVIGVGVVALIYRGVAAETGPFNFRQSAHLTGALKDETRRVEINGGHSIRARISDSARRTAGKRRIYGCRRCSPDL